MLKQIRKLCKPAYVYLVLSAITIILMMVQNAGASGTYKVGMYQCPCNNTAGIFLGKAIYVAFWTFILDAVCKAGYKSISWFLVLFPMILGAVLVGLVLMSGGIREGISTVEDENDFNERGNALTRFFQSFFEKLGNFLTGKGFQTERSRQLLEIKKQQENAPKNAYEDIVKGSDVGSGQDQGPRFTADYALGPRSFGSNTFLYPDYRSSDQRQPSGYDDAQKATTNKYTTNEHTTNTHTTLVHPTTHVE